MKKLLASFALFFTFTLSAALVGPGGYSESFSVLPGVGDWSTFSIGGSSTSSGTSNDLVAAAQALSAAQINTPLVSDGGNPPGATGNGVWSSAGQYVQTRPTGNNATVLMVSLQNNTGNAVSRVTVTYDYSKTTEAGEQIPGFLVLYSLSGQAGSWVVVPELSLVGPGRLTASWGLNWGAGGMLYVMFVDDNADGITDEGQQIDNFGVSVVSAVQVPAAVTRSPTNVVVGELGRLELVGGASGNPLPVYQWYREGEAVLGGTNSTLVVEEVPLGWDGSRVWFVAQNVVSNQVYTATSGVAVVTVRPDTNAPALVDAFAVGDNRVQVLFSERLTPQTATNASAYILTNAAGTLTILSAELDESGTVVLLTTSPLLANAPHTLRVSGVTDRSAAANAIAPNTTFTFIAYSYVPVNIGSPAVTGTVENVSGGVNLRGGGTAIGGTSDQFMFYYQQRNGDFDVQVRVAGLSLSDVWAKAGIMARETLQANARYAAVVATPSVSGVFGEYRATAGAAAAQTPPFPPNYPHTWLRLKRVGSTFSFYAGVDGQNWYPLGSGIVAMSSLAQVGFFACASASNAMTVAELRDLGEVTGGTILNETPPREPPGPSSRRGGLVITEIMYNPREVPGPSNSLEFVEIFNSNPFFEDISRFRLTGDISYTFPPNTILPAGAIIVVAKYPEAVRNYYGITNVFGPFEGNLPNEGGRVRLRTAGGGVMQQVDYRPRAPWPPAADGTGHSLVLARPSYGENDPRAWDISAYVDGSPGRLDPLVAEPVASVVINEFLANTAGEDYVELYNYSNQEVDISGLWLTDKRGIMYDATITNKFRIPNGTRLAPRAFIHFTQSQLGFGLEASGESLLLVNSNLTRVLDFVRFEGQVFEVPSGRYPDGSPTFHPLAEKTPGRTNAPLFIHDIVINEIMYNPISGNEDDEYLELYNKGSQAVDLSRWRFIEGIDYRFPVGVTLGAGQYLVVAKNVTNLLAKYPHLNTANCVGNYGGSLANGGERIALALPEYRYSTNQSGVVVTNIMYALVDEVTYRDAGRWGQWSDGRGSSLELIDPRSDNRLSDNWADSDETLKAPWTNVVWTELADHVYPRGSPGSDLNEIQVMNLGKGEFLMDDVAVRATPTGPNTVINPNFNTISGWVIQGNHVASRLEPAGPGNPSQSLRVISSAGGDNGANRVECDLNTTLAANTYITIEAKLRWLRGHRDVLLRLHGGGVEALVTLPVPPDLGTPGLPNSRRAGNNGPAIIEVKHSPVTPAANVPVKVTARVHDPDGIGAVQLRYRLDPSTSYTLLTMYDDGTNGDVIARDGIYTAVIPGQAAGTLVAFYVQATDQHATPATTVFPAGAPTSECLVRFGDLAVTGNLGVYRIWMTQNRYNTWSNRERLSNEPMEATFVYGNFRAIYGAGARYRGSPFTRNPANPLATGANFVWVLPEDDPLLGSDELNLDSLEPTGRDATGLRELTSFTMFEQLGYPFSYQRFVHPVINGTHCGSPIYTDSQQVNRDYVQMWFADADEGDIYKIDDWFEFDDTPARQSNKSASLQNFTTVGGVKKKARYRWCWEKKFNGTLNDDYSSLYLAVDAFNAPDSSYISAVEEVIEVEQWITALAFRHVIGDWDGYGYNRGKNQFVYYPNGGRWHMLMWDLDFSLGCNGGHGPTQDLFTVAQGGDTGENHMPEVARLYAHPYFRRIYLRALQRCADTVLTDAYFMPKLDARYRALQANNINVTSPYVGSGAQGISIPDWIRQRRTYILQQVPQSAWAVQVPAVQTNANNVVTLSGLAPVTVKSIRVNGQIYPVSWTNYTRWGVTLVANDYENTFVVEACDHNDQPIPGMSSTHVVYYTGSLPSAIGTVMFSEIMYAPVVTNAEYVEIYNASGDFGFDLSGWRINGLDYEFPLGTIIRPQQRLLVVKDRAVVAAAYGTNAAAAIVGVFNGRLDPDGETLTLLRPNGSSYEVVDRVRYEPGAPWPAKAAGGGAALQLVDGRRDRSRPLNWSDGDGWRFKSFTMTNVQTFSFTNLYFRLFGPGEVYLDGLRIEEGREVGVGTNYVVNGGFEEPLEVGWRLGTVVQGSERVRGVAREGEYSLRLVSTGLATTVGTTLSQVMFLKTGTVYTVSLWYLPSVTMTNVEVYATTFVRSNVNVNAGGVFRSPGMENPVGMLLPELPRVYLNEVQAENGGVVLDNMGEAEPWVELYNGGSEAVDLTGWSLAGQYTNLAQWAFPAGTVLGPGEYRLVWCDGQEGQTAGTNLHTNFRLAAGAGSVALVMPVNGELKVLDYLNYTNLAAGQSYGDFPDGQMFYRQYFQHATPGGTNNPARPAQQQIYINEWMASNTRTLQEPHGLAFEDWFELYNPGNEPADLAGYYLTDAPNGAWNKFRIPAGYVIPPRGYLLVWADNRPDRNSTNSPELHVNFALSRNGDDIALYAPDGRLIDLVSFGAQTSDVSQGRYPDGSTTLVFMQTPTPGRANVASQPPQPPVFNLGALTVNGAQITLGFQTVPGRNYQAQYKDRLSDPQWLNLGAPQTATGATLTIQDSIVNRPSRFYRIVEVP